tara:strand:- start:4373 stop:5521 length:1149 start_codon:yes stop_codon:yes gene_type:complete
LIEKKILFVSDCVTENNGKGVVGSSNLKSISRAYGKENVDIYLVSHFKDLEENSSADLVNKQFLMYQNDSKAYILFESLCLRHFRSTKRVEKKFKQIISDNHYDVIFFDDSYFGNLVRAIKKKSQMRSIVFFHNCRRNLALNWLYNSPLKFLPFYFSTRRQEKLSSRFADKIAVLNDKDSELIKFHYNRNSDAILPVAIDCRRPLKKDIRFISKKLTIGFLGANYHPNVNGISWFISNVLPLLDESVVLLVAGKGMDKVSESLELLNKSQSTVSVSGFVDDLRSWYANIDIVVSPIFEGGGMKVKVAEALSYGKYILLSPDSYHGYTFDVQAGIVCCDEVDFAKEINRVKALGMIDEEAVYQQFNERHSIDAAQRNIRGLID